MTRPRGRCPASATRSTPTRSCSSRVLQALGARHIEVRSAWDTNIVDLDDEQLDRLAAARAPSAAWPSRRSRRRSARSTSPPIEATSSTRLEPRASRPRTALGAPLHPHLLVLPAPTAWRSRRSATTCCAGMRALRRRSPSATTSCSCTRTRRTSTATSPTRVLDLIESVGSDALRVAWDNANFVQVGVRPFTDGYALLRPYLEYLQVKDALAADRRGRAGRRGRRRAARDPDRAARRRLHRIRLARAAPRRSSTASAASPARRRSAAPPARSPRLTDVDRSRSSHDTRCTSPSSARHHRPQPRRRDRRTARLRITALVDPRSRRRRPRSPDLVATSRGAAPAPHASLRAGARRRAARRPGRHLHPERHARRARRGGARRRACTS